MQIIERNVISIPFRLDDYLHPVRKLMVKYRSVPMSLADVCLVRMSEHNPKIQIYTADSDFDLDRKHGRGVIPIIMPQ